MKIIELLMHTYESDDDEDEDLPYLKKHYEVLKNELALDKAP